MILIDSYKLTNYEMKQIQWIVTLILDKHFWKWVCYVIWKADYVDCVPKLVGDTCESNSTVKKSSKQI